MSARDLISEKGCPCFGCGGEVNEGTSASTEITGRFMGTRGLKKDFEWAAWVRTGVGCGEEKEGTAIWRRF